MSPRPTADWDARTYDRLAAPQEAWARKVLERLPLDGGETVLDAGCGSGRVTKLLLGRLPQGRLVGVDGSPSMIESAREAFAGDGRVTLIVSDLLELSPELLADAGAPEAVDAAFSNATFHWIADHETLFARIHSVLHPDGRLVAQCGGRGNVEVWREAVERASELVPFREHVGGYRPWNFYGPEETAEKLEAAGFDEVRCWLEEIEPIVPENPRDFVSVVGLASHRDRLPEELREPFTDAVLAALPARVELRYVRLNIDARRPNG
ncbi:MAG: class I SAM-dependent methyltransferase [Solirubrobacterales bacterium]